MKKSKYKSQQGNSIVEVTPEVRRMVDAVYEATRVPRRHIVERALKEYVKKNHASILR